MARSRASSGLLDKISPAEQNQPLAEFRVGRQRPSFRHSNYIAVVELVMIGQSSQPITPLFLIHPARVRRSLELAPTNPASKVRSMPEQSANPVHCHPKNNESLTRERAASDVQGLHLFIAPVVQSLD